MVPMIQADTHAITLPATVATPAEGTSTFFFDGEAIHVIDRDGVPCFVAGDVARAIGHRDAYAMTRLLRDKEKGTHQVCTPGGVQSVTVITEQGLYRSILLRQTGGAKLAPATRDRIERFQDWVTGEVLPTIRRNGFYAVPAAAPAPLVIDVRDKAQLSVIALQLVQVNQEQAREIADLRVDLAESETRHELNRPRLEAYEAFLDDEGLCNLRSAARAIDAPAEAFFAWLKERSWIVKEDGWLQPGFERRRDKHMVVRMRPADGKMRPQTYVTRGGLVFLRDRWQAKLIVDAREAERARIQSTLDL